MDLNGSNCAYRGMAMHIVARDRVVGALLASAALLLASVAHGQTVQVLDHVAISNKTHVLEMQFDDPAREFDFSVWGVQPVTGFFGCQLTPTLGLFCVDGKEIRNWPAPEKALGTGDLVLNCTDPTLDLDRRRANPCTSISVELGGALWIAGRDSRAHRLLKVVPRNEDGSCPEGNPLQQGPYCAQLYASGRPLLEDVSVIDGDQGVAFKGPNGTVGPGALGLEERGTVTFFTSVPNVSVPILSGKSQWGLSGNEQLQSATLLQLTIDAVLRNFALVTTSNHRILAVDTENPTAAFEVFRIRDERLPGTTQCNFDAQQYGIRASTKSGRIYLTDRNFCQAIALEPAPAAGKPFKLQNALEDGSDLTFSTASFAPDAPTLAPGVVIDLSTCTDSCTLLSAENGDPAATLANVTLAGDESNMILLQVKNVPDCRWIEPKPTTCQQPGVIINPEDPPEQQYLNFTPLMPKEIKDLYDASGIPPEGLPRMLIKPQFRGQQANGFLFEMFFGIPAEGVTFTGVFDGSFDVRKLAGTNLGCGYDYSEALKPNLDWDAVTTVSERFVAVGGPGPVDDPTNPNRYVDTLSNVGCVNPTSVKGGTWSAYIYNLQPTPNGDAVFAKLLVELFNEFEEARAELACQQVDASGLPPLSPSTCSTLVSQWDNAKDKLCKCLDAVSVPKQSSGDQNCQSFTSQLGNVKSTLEGAMTYGPDPANRRGQLLARTDVMLHVHLQRFLPSVPLDGMPSASEAVTALACP